MCIRNRIIKPLWAGRPRILRVGGVLGSGVRINTCGSRPLAGQWDAVIQREVCCGARHTSLQVSRVDRRRSPQAHQICRALRDDKEPRKVVGETWRVSPPILCILLLSRKEESAPWPQLRKRQPGRSTVSLILYFDLRTG